MNIPEERINVWLLGLKDISNEYYRAAERTSGVDRLVLQENASGVEDAILYIRERLSVSKGEINDNTNQ